MQYIYFCTNVLHVNWNLACPIIVHFIFLMLPQIHKNAKKHLWKIKSWWTTCRSCWSGQRFSSTSHLMFSIAMHRGKNLLECRTALQWSVLTMSSHAAFIASSRDSWSCGLWSYTPPPCWKNGSDCAVGNPHIYQRYELIFSKKEKHLRIEPKQLRKTVKDIKIKMMQNPCACDRNPKIL